MLLSQTKSIDKNKKSSMNIANDVFSSSSKAKLFEKNGFLTSRAESKEAPSPLGRLSAFHSDIHSGHKGRRKSIGQQEVLDQGLLMSRSIQGFKKSQLNSSQDD